MTHQKAKRVATKKLFLEAYESHGQIAPAVKQLRGAGLKVTRYLIRRWRENDPKFAKAMEDAFQLYIDQVESNLIDRAANGWKEPVFHNGIWVGDKTKYSDTAAIFILKKHRPERYADDPDTSTKDAAAAAAAGGVRAALDFLESHRRKDSDGDAEGATEA